MARGNNVVLPSGTGKLVSTLFAERETILILNPNNGVVFVKQNAAADPVTWDWIVPSQSRAYLPGPWLEYGLYFVDQSGANQGGNLTIFESDQKIDIPDYAAIGVAQIVRSTQLDIVEGAQPGFPAGGILRLWADNTGIFHVLTNTQDAAVIDTLTAAGGDLTGGYPSPTIAANAVTNGKLATGSVDSRVIADGQVTAAKLANNIVDNSKMAGGAALTNIGFGGLPAVYIQEGTIDNGDLAAGVAFANLAQGQIVQESIWQLASDTYNNSGMSGEASAGLAPTVSIPEAGDILMVTYKGNYQVVSPSVSNQQWGWDFLLDGALATAGYGPRVFIGTQADVSVCETLMFTGLAAGNHTLNPYMFCTASQSAGVYLRCSSVPSLEHLSMYALVFRR